VSDRGTAVGAHSQRTSVCQSGRFRRKRPLRFPISIICWTKKGFLMLDRLPVQNARGDYTRQRHLVIGDLLLENRIIFLDGVINDASANLIVMKLLYLQSESRNQDINLYVNSPGGSVTATMAIYDTMQFIDCDVATYCVGLAASGGAVLVAGGAKGKRYALPHSKVMIHQPYGEVGGQVSDIEIQAEDILQTRQVLNGILASHTGQPIEVIARDTDRDRFMTATQAMAYGLVDEILSRPDDKKKSDSESN
jgi:ATP-dependent Clp protease protease subunit